MSISRLNLINATWVKINKFELINNVICLSEKSVIEEYNPFYYYTNPIDQNIVNEILGDSLNRQQDFFIHNLLLSIDHTNTDQILKWIKHFGVLFPFADKDNSFTHDPNDLLSELPEEFFDENDNLLNPSLKPVAYLNEISEEIHLMQFTITAIKVADSNYAESESFIKSILIDDYFMDFLSDNGFFSILKGKISILPETDNVIDEQLRNEFDAKIPNADFTKDVRPIISIIEKCRKTNSIQLAFNHLGNRLLDELIEFIFSTKLHDISPLLKSDNGKFTFKFINSSLAGLIYFFIALNTSANVLPRKCFLKSCHRYFIPTRDDAIYCSDTCKNRAKQQRHRAKAKQQKVGE